MDRLSPVQLVYIIRMKGGRQYSCAKTKHYDSDALAMVDFGGGR